MSAAERRDLARYDEVVGEVAGMLREDGAGDVLGPLILGTVEDFPDRSLRSSKLPRDFGTAHAGKRESLNRRPVRQAQSRAAPTRVTPLTLAIRCSSSGRSLTRHSRRSRCGSSPSPVPETTRTRELRYDDDGGKRSALLSARSCWTRGRQAYIARAGARALLR